MLNLLIVDYYNIQRAISIAGFRFGSPSLRGNPIPLSLTVLGQGIERCREAWHPQGPHRSTLSP